MLEQYPDILRAGALHLNGEVLEWTPTSEVRRALREVSLCCGKPSCSARREWCCSLI